MHFYKDVCFYSFYTVYMKRLQKSFLLAAFAVVFGFGAFTVNAYEHGDDHGAYREEVRAAVEAGDYSLLPEGADMTEEEFDEKVEAYEERQAFREEVEEAIANEDYDMFKALMEERHEEKQEEREEKRDEKEEERGDFCESDAMTMDTPRGEKMFDEEQKDDFCSDEREEEKEEQYDEREELTDEEKEERIQTHYDDLLAYYEEHDGLPSMLEMKKEKIYEAKESYKELKEDHKEMRQEMRKERKHFKMKHRMAIKPYLQRVKRPRLENVLQRIDVAVPMIQDERILDMVLGIQELIQEILADDEV